MKKVSVIVPVYNAEQYLIRCLSNLVNQTLKEIEIILVNDQSTDGSLAIMKQCQLQFPNKIKIVDLTENLGPGGARNQGILAADSEFIGFVDSDDMVDPSMYEKMYQKAMEGNYDIVDCGYYNEKEDSAIIHTSDDLTGKLDARKRSDLIVSGGYIWSKIFRADLIKGDEKMEFRNHAILEDADFLTYTFAKAGSIGNVKEILYKYVYHPQNISESNTEDPYKYYDNIYQAITSIYSKVKDVPFYADIQAAVEYEIVQLYLYGMIICLKNKQDMRFQADKKMRELKSAKERMVSISYKNNPYIKAKITGEDWNLLVQI